MLVGGTKEIVRFNAFSIIMWILEMGKKNLAFYSGLGPTNYFGRLSIFKE